MAHITGGGLAANLARVMPEEPRRPSTAATGCRHRSSTSYAVSGEVSQDDLESTLNCGVGMVALVPAADVDRALATLDRFGVHAGRPARSGSTPSVGGEVRSGGEYAGWSA